MLGNTMTNPGNTASNCECQYTLTLTDQIVHRNFSPMKDSFNHVPNIHEVVEDDTDEEYVYSEGPSNPREDEVVNKNEEESNSGNGETSREIAKDLYVKEKSANHGNEETSEEVVQSVEQEGLDDDDSYTNESFYSDESYDEFEENIRTGKKDDSCTPTRPSNYKLLNSCRTPESGISEGELREDVEECATPSSFQVASRSPMTDKSLRQTRVRRKNMSFTDEQVRRIERENQLLLRKIMAQQKQRDKIFQENVPRTKASSSAINRKKFQRQIEYDNMLLLQRIQQTKSCVMNTAAKPGCRLTFI